MLFGSSSLPSSASRAQRTGHVGQGRGRGARVAVPAGHRQPAPHQASILSHCFYPGAQDRSCRNTACDRESHSRMLRAEAVAPSASPFRSEVPFSSLDAATAAQKGVQVRQPPLGAARARSRPALALHARRSMQQQPPYEPALPTPRSCAISPPGPRPSRRACQILGSDDQGWIRVQISLGTLVKSPPLWGWNRIVLRDTSGAAHVFARAALPAACAHLPLRSLQHPPTGLPGASPRPSQHRPAR